MTTTKIFAITINPEELPGFDAQALHTVLEAALTDDPDKPILMEVNEVSISIPLSVDTTNIPPQQIFNSAEEDGYFKMEALPADKDAKLIDVATKNAELMASKGTVSFSDKLKDIKGTPIGEIKETAELKPTGEALPHNAPGKNILCSNPQRTRESIRGTGSIEFCATCGFQYRDSDLGR